LAKNLKTLNPYNNTPTVLLPDSNRAAAPLVAPTTVTEGAVSNHGSQVPDNPGRCNRKTGFPPSCSTTIGQASPYLAR